MKKIYQKLTRGYTDDDILSADKFIIEKLKPIINDFVEYSCESGLYLPEKYQKDPAGWLKILRNIQDSFNAVKFHNGYQEFDGDRKKISKGFELFGKYILDLKERF